MKAMTAIPFPGAGSRESRAISIQHVPDSSDQGNPGQARQAREQSTSEALRLVRARGESSVHLIRYGTRRLMPSAACLFDWRASSQDVAQLERAELEDYEWMPPVSHLVRSPNGDIGWIQGGFHRRIAALSVAEEMGLDLSDCQSVSSQRLRSFPAGPPLTRPEPNLVLLWGPELTPVDLGAPDGATAWLLTFAVQVLNVGPIMIEGMRVLLRAECGTRHDSPCSEPRMAEAGEEICYRALLRDMPAGRYTASCAYTMHGAAYTIPMSGLHPDALCPRKVTF